MAKSQYWNNKVVLVTGGSSGIGLALAKKLAAQEAQVWILARRREALAAAQKEIGAACRTVAADVADWQQVQKAVGQIIGEAGVPDVVINSAGVTHPGYVQELPLEKFESLMQVNYFGTVYVIKSVLPGMMARGSGHIINISSMAGYQGAFGYTAYCGSKFAVTGFSEALRAEMKKHNIRVSVAFPPDTDTPQLAYEEPFKPPETRAIAGSVAKALSADKVAGDILKQAARGAYLIFPGFDARLFYILATKLPKGLVFAILDMLAASGNGKKNK